MEDRMEYRLEDQIERLQARVAALESALEERSRELRLIQRNVCQRDFLLIARLRAGLAPLPRGAFEPGFWRETTELTAADVEDTLRDLWSSFMPPSSTPSKQQEER